MATAQRDERLPLLITPVVLGLALSALVPLPAWDVTLHLLGSELRISFSGMAQSLLLVAILVCVGVDDLVRERMDRSLQGRLSQLGRSSTYWALPTLLAALGMSLLHGLPWWGYQLALALLTGVGVAAVVALQLATRSLPSLPRQGLRLVLHGICYVTAYVLLSLIFGLRLRSLLSAPAVMAVSGGVALELLRSDETAPWRTWLYAVLIALVMGQLTWALNYTRLSNQAGGALLLLAFYLLTGLTQQQLWGRLGRRVLLEYLLVLGLGLATVALLL